jgi:hypothetical protein
MKGDFHVRFREQVGVRFPCLTRLPRTGLWAFIASPCNEFAPVGEAALLAGLGILQIVLELSGSFF